MGRALEALRVSFSHDDIAVGAHGTRDHGQLTVTGSGGALSVHPDLFPVMGLQRSVIMVTIDLLGEFHGRIQVLFHLLSHNLQSFLHHALSVFKRVFQRQVHPQDIVLSLRAVHRKERQTV